MNLQEAQVLAEDGKYDKAWPFVKQTLEEEPDDPKALTLASFMLEKQNAAGLAYQIAKRLVQLHPNHAVAWLNLGKVCDTLWRMEEAEAAYRRAMNTLKPGDDATKLATLTNLAAMFLQMGRFKEAQTYSERALKIDPKHLKSRHNLGISLLAEGQWSDGWKQYEASVGSPQRLLYKYNDEPTWEGERGGTVVVYGEQGIGDEICAASMFSEAVNRATKLIIDCDPRLRNIFARSFPQAKVYGTRNAKVLNWPEEDHKVDYSIASMQLGSIFRPDAASFPGTPYLVPDPERVIMWKALWGTKHKPVLGIAWSGGIRETASRFRVWNHEQIAEIMRSKDAHWVCLQYKDATEELKEFTTKYPDIDIVQYPYATLTKDYDDMCALVASLDGVVAMQSTAVHTAGALGIPCAAGIPKTSQWRYGSDAKHMPWYNSVELFRQTQFGVWDMSGIKNWLKRF